MNQSFQRFEGVANYYARFRPRYPDGLLHRLRNAILDAPSPKTGIVADVGSGTGIFAGQLAAALPPDTQIVGVEPASAMRARAGDASGQATPKPNLRFVEGTAEHLPFDGETARAVTAATAAHWFDRPRFYAEARRVLAPSGVLAIVQYLRDVDGSPAAAALTEFMARHGGPKDYVRPDYPAELARADGFTGVARYCEPVTFRLAREQFVGLALASSHASAVQRTLGTPETEAALHRLAEDLAADSEAISYGFVFEMFLTRRA